MAALRSFIPAVLLAAGLAGPALAADEIHWTIKGQTAVTFDWRGTETTIRYGTTTAYGTTVTAVTPNPVPISSAGPFWEARLTGLSENTRYHYSIGSGPDHTFQTPPPRGATDFFVYVEGDIGPGVWPRMADEQAMIASDPPSFVLAVGDLTYANDEGQQAVDQHFNGVMPWSQDIAYMPTWGNHEYDEGPGMQNYKGRFDLPNAQASSGQSEEWSWFDYGNVRFISYPEWGLGTGSDWNTKAKALMDQAQSDPAIKFIVTFGHEPAYSSGWHSGEPDLASYIGQLGTSHSKYVLNLNGHSHDYERSYPQSGVTHITAGIGGASLEEASGSCLWVGGCPPPAWSAFRAMHHGLVKLHITANRIDGQMICGPAGDTGANINDITCTHGSVVDSWTISAPGGSSMCAIFPPDNIWNTDISTLPVHPMSATWVATVGGSKSLWPGFAPNTFGMKVVLTNASTPKVNITIVGQDPLDSDVPGPYPFTATTPLEVGTPDAHAFMIDTTTCTLYEMYLADWNNGNPQAHAAVIWNLASNALRPDGRPSADEAGLALFCGLTRWDEVQAGAIRHALRFEATEAHINGTPGAHLWPARNDTQTPNSSAPPMGARFRLKAGYNISGFSPRAQVVLRALQHYGMFLSDVGLDWELVGTADPGWDTSVIQELQTIPANQFEAVDESSLMVNINSAQARPPSGADTTPPAPVADLRVRH